MQPDTPASAVAPISSGRTSGDAAFIDAPTPGATESNPADPTTARAAPPPQGDPSTRRGARARAAQYGRRFSGTGGVVALLFYCFSLTPSLIPRTWLYQGVITGICVVAGYGFGVFLQWLVATVGFTIHWSGRARTVARWTFGVVAAILMVLFVILGVVWQNQIRVLFGMDTVAGGHGLLVILIAGVVALLILQIARGLRQIAGWLTGLIDRWVPKPLARLVSVVAVTAAVLLLLTGVIWNGTLSVLNSIYSTANDAIDPDLAAPTDAERSGSPASPETWESLGAAGRTFVAGGPSLDQLRDFASAGSAVEPADVRVPIRVYGALDPAGDLDATAANVVAELDRTNAWDRSILVVATTTGTGWIDPGMSDSLELMHGGDTAIATMQYSYLPSWISFVGDRETPPAAGKALFEAVFERWSELPEQSRPRLVAHGISLGSFGMQGAFSGVQDVSQRTDGALFLGTPSFTPLAAELTEERDPGSLQRVPILDGGEQVRWGEQLPDGIDLWQLGPDWDAPRVVYVQHASDGVVWWSPTLLWSKPDWLREPTGPDVSTAVNWYPVATFWQLTADLFVAGGGDIPQGHGHNYRPEYADALAALWAPSGWSETDTDRLKVAVAGLLSAPSGGS